MKKRIYLYSSGNLLRRENNLCFETKDNLIYLPIFQIECINIFNHVNISKNTIILLSRFNIIINFFDYHGNYCGSYYPYIPTYGIYIEKQVLYLHDLVKKLCLGKEIISTSMNNMLSVIKYYHKKRKNLGTQITKLENIALEFKNTSFSQNDQMMIYEAKFKSTYYSCFSSIVLNNFFTFDKRSTRPPRNAINALMSYGYNLLYTMISNSIHRSRLQISLPIIHGDTRNQEGLQYDIADIFKPIIIDRLIFRLINKNQILPIHFDIYTDKVYLNKLGIEVFIENYEKLLSKTIYIYESKRNLTYRNIISMEVHKISNHIIENKQYKGFRMKW